MLSQIALSNIAFRCYQAARRTADRRKRLQLLTQHVLEIWVETLSFSKTTGCKPLIVTAGCYGNAAAQGVCGGLGDRVLAAQLALWQVQHGSEHEYI